MKKKLLLAGVTACLFTLNANATEIKPYMEGKFSKNWTKAELKADGLGTKNFKDQSFGGSLEIGAKLNQFRFGLEGYYNDDLEDNYLTIPVKGETRGAFLNAYYDISLPGMEQVKPYIGTGIGYSWLKETADYTQLGLGKGTSRDRDVGWNIGFGVAYEITSNVDLTLGYRYEDLGKIKDAGVKTGFTNHKVSLGLRYNF